MKTQKKKKKWLRGFFVEAARRINGVKRWEMASQMWHDALELRELGRKYHDAKRIA